jgi:hypothetical protein
MGRGLSELRSFILERAEDQPIFVPEILIEYYGWKPLRQEPWGSGIKDRFGYPVKKLFSRRKIGQALYGKTMATVSRACFRLQERGLVSIVKAAYSQWTRIEVTWEGREYLSVKQSNRCDLVNR